MITRKQISPEARDTYVITSIQSSGVADRVVGVCPVRSQLVKVYAVYGTAAGQAGTLAIERLQSTETSSSGDHVVIGMDLYSTANTVIEGTILTTSDMHIFEAGNRVGTHVNSGSAASCANLVVCLQFRPVDA
jgi:predicted ABC-type sugar transport system permease subunit